MARLIRLPLADDPWGPAYVGLENGIIKAHQVEHVLELHQAEQELRRHGEAALEQARAQADMLLAQAASKVAQACTDAERQATAEWHQRQLMMEGRRAERQRLLHQSLAAVVTTAVERLVQVQDRSALYQRALQTVQSLAEDLSGMIMRVSPHDEPAARAGLEALRDNHEAAPKLKLVVDASLRSGSCIFESDTGVLDASLQTQLFALNAAMGRAVKRALMSTGEADSETLADETHSRDAGVASESRS